MGLAVADVSGKGIPAALFMMSSRTVLKAAAIGQTTPGEVLGEVNAFLQADNPNFMFVTILYAIYDPDTGVFTFANGGHCPPLLVRSDGSACELPGTKGVALGLKGRPGVPPPRGAARPRRHPPPLHRWRFRGLERREGGVRPRPPAGRVRRLPAFSAREANDRLIEAVADFSGGRAQFDDITCLAVHRTSS